MKKTLGLALMGLVMLALSACGTLSAVSDGLAENSAGTKIAVQYATLKAIEESSDTSAGDILASVERARAKVTGDESVTLSRLKAEAGETLGIEDMAMSDRLLLANLLALVEQAVGEVPQPGTPLSDQQRVRILTLLDWVESAAKLAG